MATPSQLTHMFGDEFEVLRLLGRGTYSSVYLARDTGLRRLVSIKLLGDKLVANDAVRRRFEREARSAAKLSHPNIVSVYRVARLGSGAPYIVMEYVDGQNLTDALSAGVIDRDTGYEILRQMADALAHAHGANVIHRDVCPDNIIWDASTRRAVLTDFGIAAMLETGNEAVTRLTRMGEVLGTPQYSSPEQLRGDPLTGAADVFSLAIVAYEIFAGRGPYEPATNPALMAAQIMTKEPARLGDLAPDVDRKLAGLLTRALDHKPGRRPRAADLVTHVDRMKGKSANPTRGSLFGTSTLDQAAESLPAFQGFIHELRQRRVFNVALIYIAAAYATLELASLILPELPLPGWSYTALVALVLAGFPLALALSWTFDLTSGGIRRSEEVASSRRGVRMLRYAGLAASLLVAGLIGWWILGG